MGSTTKSIIATSAAENGPKDTVIHAPDPELVSQPGPRQDFPPNELHVKATKPVSKH